MLSRQDVRDAIMLYVAVIFAAWTPVLTVLWIFR